jgi:cytochrome b561
VAQPRHAPASYDAVYKTLHWVIVALVLTQYCTKLISPKTFAGVTEDGLNAWHVAVGPTILLLMLVRLAWRLTHRPPPPPRDLPPSLRLLSRATHWAFYALLIAIPILGWVAASGYGVRPWLFGLIPLPPLAGQSKSLGESVGEVHGTLAWALLAVIALHVCGAMYHALAKQDGVFQRMLPFGRPGAP